jgi:hypothetical protein
MIDVETNLVLGLEVTSESVQNDRMFVLFPDQVQHHCSEEHQVFRVLADGAYDRNELSNALGETEHPCWNQETGECSNPFDGITLSGRVCQRPDSIGMTSTVVVDNRLWDAVEGRGNLPQPQTDLWRRNASDVPGDVPRDPDESERLQYVDGYGGLSESATGTGRGTRRILCKTADIWETLGEIVH